MPLFPLNVGSSGTVTSVALLAPSSILTVSGSPVTTTGTLALALAVQNANKVWAGPTTGADATPTFRSLVAADLPTIAINKGGTGQTTKAAAFDALSPFSALGDTLYGGASGTGTTLTGNTTATKKFLNQTGTGTVSAAPIWSALVAADIPSLSATYALTGAATGSGLTMSTARLLGRTTTSSGAIEEISVGTSLSLSAGAINTVQGIQISSTPQFTRIGLGAAALTDFGVNLVQNQNDLSGFQITNANSGANALIQNRLVNDSGAIAYYGVTASTYVSYAPINNRAFFGSYLVDTAIFTQTANDIIFLPNGSEKLRIDSNGNMLIKFTALVPGNPAAGSFYQYVDPNDGKLKARGSSGTITILAVP